MKTSLLTFLSSRPSSQFNSNYRYRSRRVGWLRKHMYKGCYLCGIKVVVHQTSKGVKHPSNMVTLDHYVPVWFLKAIRLPEGIIHTPNFRVCCYRCNTKRDVRVRTVGALRADVGDELIDKLMQVTGVHLPDEYRLEDNKLKTPAK